MRQEEEPSDIRTTMLIESGDLSSQICASRQGLCVDSDSPTSITRQNIRVFMRPGQDALDSFWPIFKTLAVKQDASALFVYHFAYAERTLLWEVLRCYFACLVRLLQHSYEAKLVTCGMKVLRDGSLRSLDYWLTITGECRAYSAQWPSAIFLGFSNDSLLGNWWIPGSFST